MLKIICTALGLFCMLASANAIVLHDNTIKPKNNLSKLAFVPSKAKYVAQYPTSLAPSTMRNKQSSPIIEQQNLGFLTRQSKSFLNNQTTSISHHKKPEHGSNARAVPSPAALPLLATVFVIYGIARRRKAFK